MNSFKLIGIQSKTVLIITLWELISGDVLCLMIESTAGYEEYSLGDISSLGVSISAWNIYSFGL